MKVWQANLGRGVTPTAFDTNLRAVLRAGGKRAVYLWQEIDEADQANEMDRLIELTKHTHQLVGETTHVPILVPVHLPIVSSKITPACTGIPRVTPARQIVEAVVALPNGLEVALLGTHMPTRSPQTASRRDDVREALRKRARLYDRGLWAADTNTPPNLWPTIVRGEVSVTAAGIDLAKAWGPIGAGRTPTVTDRATVDLSIDGHNAHGSRVHWA